MSVELSVLAGSPSNGFLKWRLMISAKSFWSMKAVLSS